MREILFRGKHMHVCPENKHLDGTWVEGYLEDENHINDGKCEFLIDPGTICRYTGLTDKNGKKIWENDIISYQRDNDDCPFPNKDTKKRLGKVFYQGFRSTFAIGMGRNGSRSINDDLWKYVQNGNRVEVIGNRFDNPELLEEQDGEINKNVQ